MLDLRALGVRATDVGAIETIDIALLLKHLRLEPASLQCLLVLVQSGFSFTPSFS